MTYQLDKTVTRPLVLVLLGIYCIAAQSEIYDITELQQPDTSSPAMTGFYTVTPDGETTLENPVESGFAISAGSDFDPERVTEKEPEDETPGEAPGKASSSKKKSQETRTVRLRIKRRPPERNLAEQFQCERHGLYYTNDGRCILPGFSRLPLIPHSPPMRGMPPMVPD